MSPPRDSLGPREKSGDGVSKAGAAHYLPPQSCGLCRGRGAQPLAQLTAVCGSVTQQSDTRSQPPGTWQHPAKRSLGLLGASGHRVDVLRAQHFVDNPIEDIEDQEGEGEDGSGDGVDALGTVDVTPAQGLPFPQQCTGWGGAVDSRTLSSPILCLQAVAQPVASEVEAALTDELFLLERESAVSQAPCRAQGCAACAVCVPAVAVCLGGCQCKVWCFSCTSEACRQKPGGAQSEVRGCPVSTCLPTHRALNCPQ